MLVYTWELKNEKYDDVRFLKFNFNSGTAEDRSANLPIFPFFGDEMWFDTQNNYNMALAVKPDDENFVLIGATNLYRSTNGFASKPTNQKLDWIGGYHPDNFDYPNLHADIHSYVFDPTNPNAMWWGHDGGLSYTTDILNTSFSTYFPWENKNNGYNVTQFYTISIPQQAGDNRIMGGTQDNGSPSFKFDGTITSKSYDVSSGDGAYCYFGANYPYVSTQNGTFLRTTYDDSGNPVREYPNYSNITPIDAKGMLFINPFAIDPSDENIVLYSAGKDLWRNNQLNSLPNNPDFSKGLSDGWTKLANLTLADGFSISTLAFTRSNPSHRLYYGASDRNESPGPPKIFKLNNANTATSGAIEISIVGAASGAYVHNISVNPDNGDEILVIFSNYNIPGIYYSNNGGQTFSSVEGNLEGNETNPGPSIRSSTILNTGSGTLYLVATSIGVYSTSLLNGSQTVWSLEGATSIGNVVVETITSRQSDGTIVAGTHGRGAFIAKVTTAGTAAASVNVSSLTLHSNPGSTGNSSFILSNTGEGTLNYSISVTGSFGGALLKADNTRYVLHKAELASTVYDKFRQKSNFAKSRTKPKYTKVKNANSISTPYSIEGNDYLFLDDGDSSSDTFVGWGDGTDFNWYNEFTVSGFSFEMDSFQFYLRTEQVYSNDIYAAIYDQSFNLLSEGYLSFGLSASGSWHTITLNPTLQFSDGETFYIELYSYSLIPYPAGTDTDAQVKNKSYYFDGTDWLNLNTISGFENGAFLIRAIGTIGGGGGGNQNPNAVANVSKKQVEVNEPITFDGSQSYDNDGQVVSYSWNFGDGSTSTQKIATHSYSQPNTYNYSLTVTDNQGSTGKATGQIIVSGSSIQYVTCNPPSGTIAPGGAQNITITLNAQNIQAGTYKGQVNITTNGGNITIPIDYLVNVEQLSSLPKVYNLSQNYPNPFNPTTNIEFSLPKSSKVSLKIFDLLGKEVASLIDENQTAGTYKVSFDGTKLASGVYYYRIEAEEYIESKKMVLLK